MRSCKIVIIEDEESLAEVMQITLNERGARTYAACDGRSGLDLVKKIKPDLILLDVKMPRMNGYQVCAEIQKNPQLRDIPVIMTTALTQSERDTVLSDEEWKRRLDVAAFISKPYEPRQVADRIFALLERGD